MYRPEHGLPLPDKSGFMVEEDYNLINVCFTDRPAFFLNAIWRITNLRPAGRALVRALGSANADTCTVAGIFLVQAKHRSIPLLLEALDRRENVPMVLRVLADVGDTSVEHALQRWVRDSDPAVAAAATDALKIVQHQPFKTA